VDFAPPRCPVYANVTALPHGDVASIRSLLVLQITRPVRWMQTMQVLAGDAGRRFVELAPGRTLTGMLRKINRRAAVESV
jgi:[acyl-carrier-protein] S-malonyltransferase